MNPVLGIACVEVPSMNAAFLSLRNLNRGAPSTALRDVRPLLSSFDNSTRSFTPAGALISDTCFYLWTSWATESGYK